MIREGSLYPSVKVYYLHLHTYVAEYFSSCVNAE